jgi:hypothetical protein
MTVQVAMPDNVGPGQGAPQGLSAGPAMGGPGCTESGTTFWISTVTVSQKRERHDSFKERVKSIDRKMGSKKSSGHTVCLLLYNQEGLVCCFIIK